MGRSASRFSTDSATGVRGSGRVRLRSLLIPGHQAKTIGRSVLAVTGVLIAVQTGGIGPVRTDAGSAHMLRAGAVSGLAGSPGGLNAYAHEPGAGSFPPVTVTRHGTPPP